MTQQYVSRVETTGEGDLVLFRDAVLTYCAALRAGQPFHLSGSDEAKSLLSWMGVRFEEGEATGRTFLDPRRPGGGDVVLLASGESLPRTPLAEFKRDGFLGTALFAALVRSSYGPDEPEYFPTSSELGFYFQEEGLRREARWDQEYLEECQAFFFEELTPAELLRAAAGELGEAVGEPLGRFWEALQGVAFLIGEQTTTLRPLTAFLDRLLTPGRPLPELSSLLEGVEEWDELSVQRAWERAGPEERGKLNRELFSLTPAAAPRVVLACGPELLRWRAES